MKLKAKDIIDSVVKCDERLRQNWIAFVTLTYGLVVLLANREGRCTISVKDANPADLKEWIIIIYPVFAVFFIHALVRAFLDRRQWIVDGLDMSAVEPELPPHLRISWPSSVRLGQRALADFWL